MTKKEILSLLETEANRYISQEGIPGPLSSLWGWRTIAETLRDLAKEIEKEYPDE